MKKILAMLSLFFVAVLSFGAFGACNKKPDKNTITIEAVNLGFGLDWLYELADAYTAKNSDVKIDIQAFIGQAGNDAVNGHSEAIAGNTDIFVFRPTNYHFNSYQGAVNTSSGPIDCIYADLTDIYRSPYADGSTMESKIDKKFADYLKVNDKYYGVAWVDDFMGVVRNKDVWNKLGLTDDDIPVTTDEMFALCQKISAKGVAPFIYSKSEEYYTSIWEIWMAQYEGKQRMDYYVKGLDPTGEFSENLYSYPGQKVALQIVEKLLSKGGNKKYIYQHTDSESLSFTDMQSYFLEGQAALCVNGSWLEIEMNKNSDDKKTYNIDCIRMPVVSELINKEAVRAGGLDTDAKLAEAIRYIDAVDGGDTTAVKPDYATDAAIAVVREARHVSFARGGADHTMVVAGWSEKIDKAKDFLKFIYSDEGMKIYYKAQAGMTLPAKLSEGNYESLQLGTFTQSVVNAMNDSYFSEMCFHKSAKVYCLGKVGINFTNGSGNFVFEMLNGKTTENIIDTNKTWLRNNWTKVVNDCKR